MKSTKFKKNFIQNILQKIKYNFKQYLAPEIYTYRGSSISKLVQLEYFPIFLTASDFFNTFKNYIKQNIK